VNSIARALEGSNDQERAGAETPEGLLRPVCTPVCVGRSEAKADRDSGAPVGPVSNRQDSRSAREEARRSPGQGFRKQALEGQTPREAPAVGGLKTCLIARHSREA